MNDRIERLRHSDLADLFDRALSSVSLGTPRQLVQVYDGGAMPTEPDHYYATYPVYVDGAETEGGVASLSADTSQTLFVDVLGKAPDVGDYLTAYHVGGRWVAERTSSQNTTCFQTGCCTGLVGGITITVYDHAGGNAVFKCTTDSHGRCCSHLKTGFYFVVPSGPGPCQWLPLEVFITKGSTITLGRDPDSSVAVCCGDCAIPINLTLTDANGTYAFNYEPGPKFWFCTTESAAVSTAEMRLQPNRTCQFAGPQTSPTLVNYFGFCTNNSGGTFTFSVIRVWGEVSFGVEVVPPGECVGVGPWYYEGSTIECSRCGVFGQAGDLATGSSERNAPWSGCFSWSGELAQVEGNLPDPVGGVVTVSG
jgi:hypothetical protein